MNIIRFSRSNVLRLCSTRYRMVMAASLIAMGVVMSAVTASAQYSQDVFNLKRMSDLYDERGFDGKVISTDGRLAVIASHAGIAYTYPLSEFQSNGHPIKVNLNYCGSVSFTCYKDYKVADRLTTAPYQGWSRFHQNRPAWIVGVGGWAVNVISCTGGSFHCDSNSNVFKRPSTVTDKDLVFVVDGYDVMNRCRDFGAPASHTPSTAFVDQINILREDGSLLNLVHVRADSGSVHPDNRTDLYSGYYVENAAGAHGYAIVDFDPEFMSPSVRRLVNDMHLVDVPGTLFDTTYTPYDTLYYENGALVDTVHVDTTITSRDTVYRVYRCLDGGCRNLPFIPRIVHYYPGNGEEVIFREYQIPYGMGAFRDYNEQSGGFYGGPTIFYLESIKSNTGPLVTFYRPRHYPYIWRGYDGFSDTDQSWTWDDSTRGRALITQFDGHRISFGYNSMIVEALGRTTTVRFDQIMRNGNATSNEMMPWANLGTLTPMSLALANVKERDARLYKSFVGYVTEIIDPMGRATTFDYEQYTRTYRNYGFPYTTTGAGNNVDVVLKNYRLKEVHEPTADYEISYYGNASELLERGTDPYPYQTTNVAHTVKKKDRSGTLLTTDSYAFDWSGAQHAVQSVTETQTDAITGKAKSTKSYYSYTDLGNLAVGMLPPRHTEVTRIEVNAPDYSEVTVNSYTNQHKLPDGSTITAPYMILPSATTTTINGIPKSHQSFSYVIDTLRKFLPDTSTIVLNGETINKVTGGMPNDRHMARDFGMEVTTKITRLHDPSNFSNLLRIDTTTYKHIGLTDTVVTWASVQWDRFASVQNYYYHRDVLHDSLTDLYRWEQLMFWPPIGVYNTDTLTDEVLSPPIYGLAARMSTADGAGAFLGGKINAYRTTITEGYGRQFLGSLLADSVIGRGGTQKLVIGTYNYADVLHQSSGGNLLSRVTNANGSATSLMYDPSFCYPLEGTPMDTCFEALTLKALNNDGTVNSRLHSPAGAAALYGKPMVETKRLRFFDTAGHISVRDLHNCYEYGFYGRPTATADPNGWLSEFEYDRNARLLTAWSPGDFSKDTAITQADTLDYMGALDEQLFGRTSYDRGIDTVVCTLDKDGLHKRVGNGGHLTTWKDDTLLAMLPVAVVDTPRCRCEDRLPLARAARLDGKGDRAVLADINHGQGIEWPQDTCDSRQIFDRSAGFDGFVGHLDYYIGPKSGVGTALRLDTAMLEATITSIYGECVHLEVDIPQLNITRTYVLNCPITQVNQSRALRGGKDVSTLQGVTSSPYGYRLLVNLTPSIPQLMALGAGSTLRINLKVTTSGAAVAFASGYFSEDARPHLLLRGKFRRIAKRTDFTLAYDHDDQSLTTISHAKVDDIRHTSNQYDLAHFPGENIRRTSATHTFGADYRVLGTQVNTVLRNGAIRLDELSNTLSGNGQVLSSTDAAGDVVSTQYDDLGRPTDVTNADGTHARVVYYYGAPADFGITDQNFFGFCAAKISINENGTKFVQYSDALDRVRREVADSGASPHLNLITRYEYDILGRMTTAINPKGDTTRYWYDEFGRVKYKRQPDLGTVSYAYDKTGNVRFTQDEEQSRGDQPRMTFSEYDDLNRLTVMGEAKFQNLYRTKRKEQDHSKLQGADTSFGRITDDLNGSTLYDGGESLILTANKTLWNAPVTATPKFWASFEADSVICSLAPDTLLGETTPPVGWFLRHPVQQWTPAMPITQNNDFENIAKYPAFIRMAVNYDTLPRTVGTVWERFPEHTAWDKLAPTGKVRNLLGREAAVAYREHGGQPFHYAVMSYDERGRAEALIRYTENLGFDAVYYTYNSMNAVTSVRVLDHKHQYTTWYGYDHNGRTDSVWTLLTAGYGLKNPRHLSAPARPAMADIVYTYTVTGQVDTMRHDPVNVFVKYAYNHRKWLDSMTATKGGTPLFKQVLTFDPSGQIMRQRWQHGTLPQVTHAYGYDSLQRLTSWYDGVDTMKYQYDQVGNRIQSYHTSSFNTAYYSYLGSGPNQMTQIAAAWNGGSQLTNFSYDPNGAVTGIRNAPSTGAPSADSLVYSYRGLLEGFLHREFSGPSVMRTAEWRYRYSAGGERESKRLYLQQDSLHNVIPHNSWVYYALGGNQNQLAVYHGQEMIAPSCLPPGPASVYFYPVEYLTYGTGGAANVITRPDVANPSGTKEFHIVDHLRSTRVSISPAGMQTSDFDPDGKLLAGGTPVREGFIGKELGKDNHMLNCGAREEFGPAYGWPGFNRIDPKWESFRMWSPYVYSLCNPLRIIDPTGEAGEATLDETGNTITVRSNLIFFTGPGQEKLINDEVAKSIIQRIMDDWNAAGAKGVGLGGQTYRVVFKLTYQIMSKKEAVDHARSNKDIKNNYVRIDTRGWSSGIDVSEWKDNASILVVGHLDGTSPSHEYGHGLGMPWHSDEDQRGRGGPPDIMTGAGSSVDPPWALPDGKVDVSKRVVTSQNLYDALRPAIGTLRANGVANIGRLANNIYAY